MNGDKRLIKVILGERGLCEQLAEEASELSQAALKYIRAKGLSSNVTPISGEEAEANLREELNDVLMVADLLGLTKYDDEDNPNPKWKRWADRLAKGGR